MPVQQLIKLLMTDVKENLNTEDIIQILKDKLGFCLCIFCILLHLLTLDLPVLDDLVRYTLNIQTCFSWNLKKSIWLPGDIFENIRKLPG